MVNVRLKTIAEIKGEAMLVLARRRKESIVISVGDERIKITLINAIGGQAMFGIDAPKSVKINREEIHNRIEKKQAKAAKCDDTAIESETCAKTTHFPQFDGKMNEQFNQIFGAEGQHGQVKN